MVPTIRLVVTSGFTAGAMGLAIIWEQTAITPNQATKMMPLLKIGWVEATIFVARRWKTMNDGVGGKMTVGI